MALTPRHLNESYTETAPLRVDREAGVIYGARILGSESRNTYGVPGVTSTEYAAGAHNDARKLYEGTKCYLNHVRDKKQERKVEDSFGVFRNITTKHVDGKPVTFGEIHYLKSHPMAGSVAEDAERGTGIFGLSHDAYAGSERVDKARKKLVIESLKSVNSIDIVTKPATNRTLSESEETPMKTLKSLLESAEFTPGKRKWAARLIEDTELLAAVESTGEDLPTSFDAAVYTVMNEPTLPASERSKRIGRLLETRERLESSADSEPVIETPNPVETPADTATEITRLLGENENLKSELSVRRLCEAEGFNPAPHHVESLRGLATESARKALIADLKKATTVQSTPTTRSGFRRVTEGNAPANDAKSFVSRIKA